MSVINTSIINRHFTPVVSTVVKTYAPYQSSIMLRPPFLFASLTSRTTVSATIRGLGRITAVISSSTSVAASIRAVGSTNDIAAAITSATTVSGTLTGKIQITAAVSSSTSTGATIRARLQITADLTSNTSVSGSIRAKAPLSAAITSSTSISATLALRAGQITAALTGTTTVGATIREKPSLGRNVDIVPASANKGISTGTENFGGVQNVYVMNYANGSRIAQTGLINNIDIYVGATRSNLTDFTFDVWRRNGSNFDLVATQSIFSVLTAGAGIKNVTLSPALSVQEGDFTGFSWTGSGTVGNLLTAISGQSTSSYYATTSPGTSNINWTGQTAGPLYVPIRVNMQSPQLVTIGDSYPSGYPSYYPTADENGYGSNMAFTFPYKVQQTLGLVGQNMGVEGDSTTNIAARFTADVVNKKPRAIIIDGGGNDVSGGREGIQYSQAVMLTNLGNCFDAGIAGGAKMFYMSIPPFTAGTNTQMQSIDSRNTAIQSLCATKNVVYVDIRPSIGVFRSGGDAGNLWNIQAGYDSGDGVHLNDAGYTVVANLLSTAIAAYIATLSGPRANLSGGTVVTAMIRAKAQATAAVTANTGVVGALTGHAPMGAAVTGNTVIAATIGTRSATTSPITAAVTSGTAVTAVINGHAPMTAAVTGATIAAGTVLIGHAPIASAITSSTAIAGTLGTSTDPDAAAFYTAAGITDSTQKNAINTLVKAYKSAGIWTKRLAIYPFVGGTATAHAVNLKTPGTFNLTFTATPTHSATGTDWNGSTQYASTGLIPNTSQSINAKSLGYYSREDSAASLAAEIGTTGTAGGTFDGMFIKNSGGQFGAYLSDTTGGTNANANAQGWYLVSRSNSTQLNMYKNGVAAGTNPRTVAAGGTQNTQNIEIGRANGQYTDRQCAFAVIGSDVTATEQLAEYNAIQAFQTTLSRQV